ncbi:MAG: DUF4294 domain-containing protein [Bacteroidales bacterium]|nr:DUF4294 domain-containing protein [Bacteroidales bacterium]
MKLKLRYLVLGLLLFIALTSLGIEVSAQQHKGTLVRALVVGRDTVPQVMMGEVQCWAKARFKNERQRKKWTKYIYNVKRALPYARLLTREFRIIEDSLSKISDPVARNAYIDEQEKVMFKKYEQQLKHLTVRQGRILIKLMDRESGHTSYEIISMLKGDFKAFWWQGIARVFGSNLKTEYDPDGMDKNLENVVMLIDMGYY